MDVLFLYAFRTTQLSPPSLSLTAYDLQLWLNTHYAFIVTW